MLKGTPFLRLKNAPKLSDKQSDRLDVLLDFVPFTCVGSSFKHYEMNVILT